MDSKVNIIYIGSTGENIRLLRESGLVTTGVSENLLLARKELGEPGRYDAIICELTVPGGDAFGMNGWVRQQAHLDEVPFIIVSPAFDDAMMKKSFLSRIDDFYVTPLPSATALVDRILFLKNFRKKSVPEPPAAECTEAYRMPFSKRLFDVVVAGSALLLAAPSLLLIALAIRLESKGRVFYTSRRVGRKPFDFYKLRSMRSGSDAELAKLAKERNQYGPAKQDAVIDFSKPCPRCAALPEGETCSPVLHFGDREICDHWYAVQRQEIARAKPAFIKIEDDPRVTKVGKFIRNTSIDELPQLFNVLKGDMSIVGNRPLPVYEAEQLTRDEASKRFLAPAGITGLWQVELRGRGGKMSEEERMRLDSCYAEKFVGNNYSFWYDLKLILRTVPALFQKTAA